MTEITSNISFIGTTEEYNYYKEKSFIDNISHNSLLSEFHIFYKEDRLILKNIKKNMELYVDFLSNDIENRINQKTAKLPLIKAIEGKKQIPLNIIDATAGLGIDSFCMASRGHRVNAIEKSPIVYSLLKNGLERANCNPKLQDISKRIQLSYGNALHLIDNYNSIDIIYLDPMFPAKKNSAKVKKNMQILQSLLSYDYDQNEKKLFDISSKVANNKVIIKRAKTSRFFANEVPSSQIIGKSNRFDIYVT